MTILQRAGSDGRAGWAGVLVAVLALAGGVAIAGGEDDAEKPIPFELFARFERMEGGNPLFALEPPRWATAAHAIVVEDTIHYLWARREAANRWYMMHSHAPVSDPTDVTHDPRNPVLSPTRDGFDNRSVEYPYPFYNPADGNYYAYYLGRGKTSPKQTGLLVQTGDFGQWKRVQETPVIPVTEPHEQHSSSHPSVAIDGDTIHILYTGRQGNTWPGKVTVCHATAPTSNPADVTKDPANPIFTGSGEEWDSGGVREAEIFKGPEYFHITYGGFDGDAWLIGHVRTKDFRTFEANPHNPIFVPSEGPDAWDSDGLLTPQVFRAGGRWYMLYAGLKDRAWQSGLAVAR